MNWFSGEPDRAAPKFRGRSELNQEDDLGLNAEQFALSGENRALDGCAVLPQNIGVVVEGVLGQVRGGEAQQLGEGRIAQQPAKRFAFGGRMQGAGEDLHDAQTHVARPHSAGGQAVAQAEAAGLFEEQASGTDFAHLGMAQAGGQRGDRSLGGWIGSGVLQDLEADVEVSLEQKLTDERGNGLGLGTDLGEGLEFLSEVGVDVEAALTAEEVADGDREARPEGFGNAAIEAGGEVRQDDLADFFGADADGMDEAVVRTALGVVRISESIATTE